jgi:hypothetical protein
LTCKKEIDNENIMGRVSKFLKYFVPGAFAMLVLGFFAFTCISLSARPNYALILVVPIVMVAIFVIFILGIVTAIK